MRRSPTPTAVVRPTSEKAAAALKSGWEAAGFKVTLNELTDTFYDVIQNPANAKKFDVVWAGWVLTGRTPRQSFPPSRLHRRAPPRHRTASRSKPRIPRSS